MASTPRVGANARRILRANPSVVGFSETLKPKRIGGRPTGPLSIRVYVVRKLAKAKVPAGRLVPPRIDGVPTDVEAIGRVAASNRGRYRPLEGGCTGTQTGGGHGTLGYFMCDRTAPAPPARPQWYALSCAHVLHPTTGQSETIQPSPADGGVAPADWVGRERLWTYDGVDAALAVLDAGAVATLIGLPTPVRTAPAELGLTVAKSGRTTGVTYGKVYDDGAELAYPAWGSAPGAVRFRGVILISNTPNAFGAVGDSGSLVIDPADRTAIGMLFGVSPVRTLVAPIKRVLAAFPNQRLVQPGESFP